MKKHKYVEYKEDKFWEEAEAKLEKFYPDGRYSDYGLYRKTGNFQLGFLPVVHCSCSSEPYISCRYDDIVGFKETIYEIKCSACQKKSGESGVLLAVISSWNRENN